MKTNSVLSCLLYSAVNAILSPVIVEAATLSAPDINEETWLKHNQSFHFFIRENNENSIGRLAFFLGASDITSVVQQTGIDRYTYNAELLSLPRGAHEFIAYSIDNENEWNKIGEFNLQILSNTGFEESEFSPRLAFSEKSQFSSRASGDAEPSDPEKFHDVSMTAGFNSRHSRNNIEVQSSWNIVGSSVKEEALRFGELESEAPRTDLSDYLVEVKSPRSALFFGHVNFGNNPLLISNLANRGVVLNYTPLEQLNFSLTSQSGQQITGYNNFFGFKNSKNNSVQAGALGYEIVNTDRVKIKAEISYLTAEITSDLDFNIGQVADSEKNTGYGLVVVGEAFDSRIRANVALARSTYQNPDDPFLSQGFDVVSSIETSDNARSIHVDLDVLKPADEENNHSLTISLHHDRADPLYKSAAAFVSADVEANAMSAVGQIGILSWQAEIRKSRDNLNDIETVLTTVTESKAVNLSLPLQALYENPKAWLPQILSYSVQRVHQFGDNLPIGFDPDSHVPNQVNLIHNTQLSWQLGKFGLGYTLSLSDQDNRQLGRDKADFKDINHGVNLSLPFTENVVASLALGVVSAIDREQRLTRYNDSFAANLDWRVSKKISLTSHYSVIKGGDSKNFSENNSASFQAQMSYQFELPMFGHQKFPGQIFFRYSLNDNDSIDNQFQFESEGRNQSINGGFNMSWN
ncbi:MAG: hypothetical protein ACRBCS_09955 [Cellvibrionaceae bacterium]